MKLLSARLDYVFKLIFADERNVDCLKDFLRAVLGFGEDELAGLVITDPFLPKEADDDKFSVLDVKLTTGTGKILNVEIQVYDMPDFRDRLSFYLSRMIAEQLNSGDKYAKLRPAICIAIVDFPMVKESENFHNIFRMEETQEHFLFNDLMEIQVLDLTKIPEDQSSGLVNWMKFLKANREEEFEMIAKTNAAIGQAYSFLRELSEDEAVRLRSEARLKAQRDEWSRIDGARNEERISIAINMARIGLDIPTIAKSTNLTLSQVETILQERNLR